MAPQKPEKQRRGRPGVPPETALVSVTARMTRAQRDYCGANGGLGKLVRQLIDDHMRKSGRKAKG